MASSQTTRALMLGAAVGFLFAALPSCGKGTTINRCNASNCDGCCDETATCKLGTTIESCGAAGATCAPCGAGQACQPVDVSSTFGGRCLSSGSGGGGGSDAGTGGGAGGGTGGGGGATGGGGGSTDGGTCGPSNCPNGCCSATGVCITQTTPSRCGAGGGACSSCTQGNTCVSGACTPCAGCININTGACEGGMQNTACGKNGGFCQACDTTVGQNCNGGTCFGGNVCNPTTCTDGCCDGNNCVQRGSYTTAQCGQGAGGAACVACVGGATCDGADAGACVGGGGSGGDGGFFDPDAGFPTICADSSECGTGQCCDSFLGQFGLCVNSGEVCQFGGTSFQCLFGGSCTCAGATQECK